MNRSNRNLSKNKNMIVKISKVPLLLLAILLVSLCLVESRAATPPERFVLVKDGVSKAAIVLPADCTPGMEYAANDLSKHLNLMSGAEVEIYKQKDDKDLPKKYDGLILITDKPQNGEAQLGSEEYKITTQAGKPWIIRIYGDNKRGAMYGSYALLQDVLGIRWFTNTKSKIPEQKTIAVGALNIHQKPSYEYREPYYWEATNHTEWIVRNRVNGSNGVVDDSAGGKVRYGPGAFVHTMLKLVPPEEYFESHPEYFAMVDGKRVPNTQLCLTNPDALKIAIDGVKKWIADNPNGDIFSVSQMDNEGGSCQCENCLKVLKEEGAESGPILRFVNAVAQEIGKEHPNVKIETIAYNYSQAPPKHVVPLQNVRVRLCFPWPCRAHSLEAPCNKETYADLLAWSKITHQLYIWDYDTEYNDLMMVHPSLNYLKTAFKVFSDKGVIGNFMLGDYVSPGGALSEMKAYLCARLMWDSNANPDTILNEYIEGVYGKSAPMVKEWIELIHSPFKKDATVREMGIYDSPDSFYLNKEIMDKSDALMKEAVAASAGDQESLDEIGKIQMWIDYTRIAQMKLKGKVENGKFTYGLSDDDLARIDRWLESVDRYKVIRIAEAFDVNKSEYLSRETGELTCLTLENDKLRVDVLPEVGGKIVRLIKKKNGKDLMIPADSVLRAFQGGFEEHVVEKPGIPEFRDVKFDTEVSGDTITLKGVSPEGREITKEYILKGDTLTSKILVKNTTAEPLPVKISTRPLFPVSDFSELEVSFDTVAGGKVELKPEDFSINWNRLFKKYVGGEMPAGKVDLKLKDASITVGFNPEAVETFQVWNEGGKPKAISLEVFGKSLTLQPDETTSFEQSWIIK